MARSSVLMESQKGRARGLISAGSMMRVWPYNLSQDLLVRPTFVTVLWSVGKKRKIRTWSSLGKARKDRRSECGLLVEEREEEGW